MENDGPNSVPMCTLEAVQASLKSTNSLPPAEALAAAPAKELTKMVEHAGLHAHLVMLLPAAFDTADPALKGARLSAVVHALIGQLDAVSIADGPAKKATDWAISEVRTARAPLGRGPSVQCPSSTSS